MGDCMTDSTVATGPTSWDYLLAIINTKPVIALVTALASAWGVTWWQGDAQAKERGVEINQVVRGAQMAQAATETMARDAVDVIIDACVAELRKSKKKG
jgi:hypothetical protein